MYRDKVLQMLRLKYVLIFQDSFHDMNVGDVITDHRLFLSNFNTLSIG